MPFGTADDCLFEFGHLQAGETALIHAGAGGVGIAAIQLAKRAGLGCSPPLRATRSSSDCASWVSTRGSTTPDSDFVAEARARTDGRGIDVIVDSVGGATLQGSLAALAYRGSCVTVGDAGRIAAEQLDISNLRPSNQTLSGYFLGAELLLSPRIHPMIAGTSRRHRPRRARVVVDRTFPAGRGCAAHAYIESRQSFGRVLLVP